MKPWKRKFCFLFAIITKLQYSQRDVYILRAHARKKKGLSSTQNPRKTLAHSSQNPRLFHAMSTFIPRKKRVSCVRYKQFHACSRFPRSLRKRSVERIKRHARKGLSFRLVQRDKIVKDLLLKKLKGVPLFIRLMTPNGAIWS